MREINKKNIDKIQFIILGIIAFLAFVVYLVEMADLFQIMLMIAIAMSMILFMFICCVADRINMITQKNSNNE